MGAEGAGARPVVAVARDLFFATKIGDAARRAGRAIVFPRRDEDLLAALRLHQPSLLILDLTAEGLDFGALLRALRADPATAALPVLAYTSHVHWKQHRDLHPLCSRVLTKEEFSRQLPSLLQEPPAGAHDG
ncbi:MAG: hypothetical protein HYV08_07030 [Deltaproteobacteria bacterium]|nr:hypothetical protein [Deltaproteobacteria bacterium]